MLLIIAIELQLFLASSFNMSPHGSKLDLPFTVHNVSVDGLNLFYRESGNKDCPVVLLLHGYPSSSHQYRHLLPILGKKYHVLAPDYPGFGFTEVPASRNYSYTFDNLAETTSKWLQTLGIDEYAVYVFDYGAPVGFRLALQNPASIKAIITQNGNAYVEGLGSAFSVLSNYYNDPTNQTAEQAARNFISFDGTKSRYVNGAPDPSVIEPESYWLDSALLARPGNVDIQLGFFRDYKTNVESYPQWQTYLRDYQPPVLAVWGANDPGFIAAGAEAFKRDVPSAEVHLLDGSHFLLETNVTLVAWYIVDFLKRKGF